MDILFAIIIGLSLVGVEIWAVKYLFKDEITFSYNNPNEEPSLSGIIFFFFVMPLVIFWAVWMFILCITQLNDKEKIWRFGNNGSGSTLDYDSIEKEIG